MTREEFTTAMLEEQERRREHKEWLIKKTNKDLDDHYFKVQDRIRKACKNKRKRRGGKSDDEY